MAGITTFTTDNPLEIEPLSNFALRLRPGGRLLGPPSRGRLAEAGRGRGRLEQDPHLRRQVRQKFGNDKL